MAGNNTFMKYKALNYYLHDGPKAFRFELAGHLDQAGARRLDQDWRTASSVIGDRELVVDMTLVTSADEDGRALLVRWQAAGARFIAASRESRALAESIDGLSIIERASNGDGATAGARRALPLLALLVAFVFPVETSAALLKPETVASWDNYLQTVKRNLQERVRPGGSFLWALEEPDREAKVRAGEIVAAPAPGQSPKKVPGGLIHHWIGAAFVRDAKIGNILEVTRDYDRYKEYYRPSVMESKAIARGGSNDKFSMVLINKAFFLSSALDMEYQATNVRVDSRRWYSITSTTHVQEVEDYGKSAEHRIPEGIGGGYIWKLFSVARFEQRDGGVFVEVEAIALSRDVPVMLRMVVDPIVRRVSRNSILISLQQTEEAVRSSAVVARSSSMPALATRGAAFTKAH